MITLSLYIPAMVELMSLRGTGTLDPERLPSRFRRQQPLADHSEVVGWWWISEWDLPEGTTAPQRVLAFPTSNLVVETTMVVLSGPTTRASTKVLSGSGWVLGALLRPAAVAALTSDPGRMRDRHEVFTAPELHQLVADASSLDEATRDFGLWLLNSVGHLKDEAVLANRLLDATMAEPGLSSVGALANHLGVSERTVHRLAQRYIGLTPYMMIRRRRLQEAAQQVRQEPQCSLAEIAARHGFVDQAHLTREFRQALGTTPRGYRQQVCAGK